MAIPDAPGDDSRRLSDTSESVGPDLPLPGPLHADAYTHSLPLTAPESNVLPGIALIKPVEVAIASPPVSLPADATRIASIALTQVNNVPAANSLDNVVAQAPNITTEVATANPPVSPPADATRIANIALPQVNNAPAANSLDNVVAQAPNITTEVATANPPVSPPADATRIANIALPQVNNAPAANSLDSVVAQTPNITTEVATANPPVSPPADTIRIANIALPQVNNAPAANSLDSVIAQAPNITTEVATANPPVSPPADITRIANIALPQVNNAPAANSLDSVVAQVPNANPPEVAIASSTPTPPIENLQRAASTTDASTTPRQALVASSPIDTGRIVAELITNKKVKSGSPPDQTNFQYVALNYVGAAPGRVEATTETPTPTPPAQLIHSQLAMAKEATLDPASPIQSYPHNKNTKAAVESNPPTSATPDALSTKGSALNPTRSTDPQSLLAALETPIRGLKSIQPTSSFTDGIVPVDKLGLPTLQTTAASVGLPTPTPLEGRIVQNIGQPAATDTSQTTLDPHKISNSLIPGAVGPGTSTGQQGEHDTSRTLHVPDLNLDEATHKPTSGKGKPHSTTDQSVITETGKVNQNTVAEAELADLLGRTKKGEKEKSEPGKIDTSTTPTSATTKQPQAESGNERLKHKVKAGETLDDIACRYFGDSTAATLIMEINSSILNPHVEKDAVIISLLVDTIVDIPSKTEVLKFRKQLASGKKTRANIICI